MESGFSSLLNLIFCNFRPEATSQNGIKVYLQLSQ